MGELLLKTSEMLRKRPLLWLPVLVADLLGFLANLGSGALVRALVLRQMQFHSALGGGPIKAPLTTTEMQHATIAALLISWCANFLRILFYSAAFVATVALVRQAVSRAARTVSGPMQRRGNAIVSLAFQALAVYAVFALLFGWFTRWAVLHGHRGWLANGWLETGISALLIAVLATLLAPAGVYAIARRMPGENLRRRAQLFAFSLGIVALLIGHYVAQSTRGVRIASITARYALEITGSWIAALPYAFAFVGVALVALRVEGEDPSLPTP